VARFSIFLFPLLLAFGCATTKAPSLADHDVSRPKLKNVVVFADFQDLRLRKSAEREFCRKISQHTFTSCVRSATLFPPDQQYSEKDVYTRVEEAGMDALITLYATDAETRDTVKTVVGEMFLQLVATGVLRLNSAS